MPIALVTIIYSSNLNTLMEGKLFKLQETLEQKGISASLQWFESQQEMETHFKQLLNAPLESKDEVTRNAYERLSAAYEETASRVPKLTTQRCDRAVLEDLKAAGLVAGFEALGFSWFEVAWKTGELEQFLEGAES